MRILLSNDDGVYAPGLLALYEEMKELGQADVYAPDRNRSGASNSLTLDHPIRAKQLDNGFVSIEGTPTDCVHLALTGFLKQEPDLVVSGVNAGANLGDDVLYSGTVAAAREGRFLGLPAIAVSLAGADKMELKHYKTAAIVTKRIVQQMIDSPLSAENMVLNVNVPDLPLEELAGIEVTRLGTRSCAEPTIKQRDPRGHTIYWVGLPGPQQDAGPGTDFYAISQKKVSLTPMRLDWTKHEVLASLASWSSTLKL